jgi:hypothetical protein
MDRNARIALLLVGGVLSVNLLHVVTNSKTNKIILAGIGTFPGGQSTGETSSENQTSRREIQVALTDVTRL